MPVSNNKRLYKKDDYLNLEAILVSRISKAKEGSFDQWYYRDMLSRVRMAIKSL